MNDRDKRELIKCMIKEIKLYMPEEQKVEGHAVKSIEYSFPIEEDVIQSLRVKEKHVESIVLLSKLKSSMWNYYAQSAEGVNITFDHSWNMFEGSNRSEVNIGEKLENGIMI